MVGCTTQVVPQDRVGSLSSVEYQVTVGGSSYPIFFRSSGIELLSNIESFVALRLLPGMKAGVGSLSVEGEISQKFYSAVSTIQDIYCCWNSGFHRVNIIDAVPKNRSPSSAGRVATFFSGGVDSFYTLLKNKDEISDLILVHGLDMSLNDVRLRSKASEKLKEVAAAFGKNLIEIETNIRDLLDHFVGWGEFGHGAALAAIGHLLCPNFSRIYMPASYTYSDLFPWGTHPVLDHLWSTEALEFVHDGCEATRVKKVSLISQYDEALRVLRVCYKNPDSAYNCGVCEKCLRTMVNLKVNNALERCASFDKPLDIKRISKIYADAEKTRAFVRENLAALERSEGNDELKMALYKVLNRPQWQVWLRNGLKWRVEKIKRYYGRLSS